MTKDVSGRVPDGTGLSSPTEPQSSQGLGPTGFDPSRGDLFGETATADPSAPEPQLDVRTEFLKERYGLPDDWIWHTFEGIDPPTYDFARYDGGVYPWAITKGKYKGRTNYKKPVPGTERSVVLSDREFKAWLPTWEARTGKCHKCRGTGQEWRGWNHITGNKYRDCPRCGATGNAPCDSDGSRNGRDREDGLDGEAATARAAEGGIAHPPQDSPHE